MTVSLESLYTPASRCHLAVELWVLRLLVNGRGWTMLRDGCFGSMCEQEAYTVRGTLALFNAMERLDDDYSAMDCATDELVRPRYLSAFFGEKVTTLKKAGVEAVKNFGDTPKELLDALRECEEELKTQPLFNSPLKENLELVGRLFDLSPKAAEILAFFVLSRSNNALIRVCTLFDFDCRGLEAVIDVAACATDVSVDDIRRLLSDRAGTFSLLVKPLPLPKIDYDMDCEIWFLYRVNKILDFDLLQSRVLDEKIFLESIFSKAIKSDLVPDDFAHIASVHELLLPYLKGALDTRKTGVNVLLYGESGTGKTELSRVVAQELGARAFEISVKDKVNVRMNDDDEPIVESIETRLDLLETAGVLLRNNRDILLVVDEAEDIFSADLQFRGNKRETPSRFNRARLNDLMRQNFCPTLWITNSLAQMDATLLRRFDIVLEVGQPTVGQRRQLIDKLAGTTLSDDMRDRLSRTKHLSPAVVTRALKVADTVAPESSPARDAKVIELVNDTLKAQGQGEVAASLSGLGIYSLDYLNTDVDLAKIVDGLRVRPRGSLCLYGQPGTGKSAYGAWVAKMLDKPLVVKRASDLFGRYLGETENNIAEAFREAQLEGAVLLIDEADTFLQDRAASFKRWEITQVNEMLTQIEAFEGIFIATTNLVDTLDPACLRRFDLKVKFKALTPDSAQRLFEAHLAMLGLEATVSDAVLRQLKGLTNLTPGDFATVTRQAGFNPVVDAEDFAQRLAKEGRLKKVNRHRPIGFG
ncbi:MAG: AAA family ATPase [Sutterellaceae bacterium]|nr:AAA family ATPase [Sutterellaceae bacterium]